MSATHAPTPTIRNPGRTPATPRKLFVNIPVADVQRSIDFFEGLGFTFNAEFTDASGTAMLVGEDAYFMLLTHEKFLGFSKRPLADPRQATGALFTLGVESRQAVDAMVNQAVALGGTAADEAQDHGFMYDWGFYDLDGHGWGVFWMDPAAAPG